MRQFIFGVALALAATTSLAQSKPSPFAAPATGTPTPSFAAKAADAASSGPSIATFDVLDTILGVQYRGLMLKASLSRADVRANNYRDLSFDLFPDLAFGGSIGTVRGSGSSVGIDFGGSPQPGEYQVGVDYVWGGGTGAIVISSAGTAIQTCPLPTNQAVQRCMAKINLPGAGPLAIAVQGNASSQHLRKIVVAAPGGPPAKAHR